MFLSAYLLPPPSQVSPWQSTLFVKVTDYIAECVFVIGRSVHVKPLARYLLAQSGTSSAIDGPSRVGACEDPCHWFPEPFASTVAAHDCIR
jgi:hypothetical protein